MDAGFLEGDFDLPPAYEPGEYVFWLGVRIGGEKGLRFEFAFGITDEEPAYRHRRDAGAIPKGGATGDIEGPVGAAIPATDVESLPGDGGIIEEGGELVEGFAFERRSTASLGLGWWEIEQVGIEPQARNDTDPIADGGEEIDGRKGTVGHQHDFSVW